MVDAALSMAVAMDWTLVGCKCSANSVMQAQSCSCAPAGLARARSTLLGSSVERASAPPACSTLNPSSRPVRSAARSDASRPWRRRRVATRASAFASNEAVSSSANGVSDATGTAGTTVGGGGGAGGGGVGLEDGDDGGDGGLRGLVERRGGESEEELGEGVACGGGADGAEGVEER